MREGRGGVDEGWRRGGVGGGGGGEVWIMDRGGEVWMMKGRGREVCVHVHPHSG